ILDSMARTPPTAACVRTCPGRTLIAVTRRADAAAVDRLRRTGVRIWVDPTGAPRVNVPALLEHLASLDVVSAMVEGGPAVAGSFFDADRVDEVHAYIAAMLIGGEGA